MRFSTMEELRQCLQDHTLPHSIVPVLDHDNEEQQDLNKDELVIHALSCVPVGSGPKLELLQKLNAMELLKFICLKDSIFPADCVREENLVMVTSAVSAAAKKIELAKLDAVLLRVYANYDPKATTTDDDLGLIMLDISWFVRKHMISKVKFIPRSSLKDEGTFGTFWRPNLVQDTPKYVDSVLDILRKFHTRREDATVLTKAAHFWMNAAPLIRKMISEKRSSMSKLMKQDVMMVLKHLKVKQSGKSCSDVEFFQNYPMYNVRVLEGLQSLLQLNQTDVKETRTPKEMVALRTTDMDAFEAFCILFLRHTKGKVSWNSSCRSSRISEIFTISDEAFAFLVLDDNINYWRKCYFSDVNAVSQVVASSGGKGKKPAIGVETKYTLKNRTGGWSNEGIRTYNIFFQEVMHLRNAPDCKTMENELMDRWKQDRREYLESTGKRPSRYDRITLSPPAEPDEVPFIYEG